MHKWTTQVQSKSNFCHLFLYILGCIKKLLVIKPLELIKLMLSANFVSLAVHHYVISMAINVLNTFSLFPRYHNDDYHISIVVFHNISLRYFRFVSICDLSAQGGYCGGSEVAKSGDESTCLCVRYTSIIMQRTALLSLPLYSLVTHL